MAITNVTDEVNRLRAENERNTKIEALRLEQAIFILKILLLAGHVAPSTMDKALTLADIVTIQY